MEERADRSQYTVIIMDAWLNGISPENHIFTAILVLILHIFQRVLRIPFPFCTKKYKCKEYIPKSWQN